LDIATAVGPEGKVLGIDASPSMIQSATELAAQRKIANCEFMVDNCNDFSDTTKTDVLNGTWDSVFSNAALHWIMRPPAKRLNVLQAAYDALKPNGRFVFEFGGAGNVAEVVAATVSALVHHGTPMEKARDLIPWFFPDTRWMETALTRVGFRMERVELVYRPTRLNPDTADGTGGLEGWFRLFGAGILRGNPKADEIVRDVVETLETVTRREDGTQWLGYVRLRGAAIKP
jgi:SAM-dependent methyltransferase